MKNEQNGNITLVTERLSLRPEKMEDAEILYRALGCDSDITRYTGWNPYFSLDSAREKLAEDIRNYDKKGCYSWIIQCGTEVVGTIGGYNYDEEVSSIEIGYSIFKDAWGHGFATEAVSKVVSFLFEIEKINRIHAWCHDENTASSKVLEATGFRQEGLLKQAIRNPDGTLANQRLYGAVYSDWK